VVPVLGAISLSLLECDATLLFTIRQLNNLPANVKQRSPTEEQYGELRLVEASTSAAPSAQPRIQNVMAAFDTHIANREQYDDVTLLAVQRKA